MRRTSRKKQDTSSSREVAKAPPPVAGGVRRQHPPPEVLQQRKKHQDEVQSLTTKNYRLAKELADLRLKHRDECKHVNRLTMENMNLASRCREAISHVAMLKKELALQQKRTAQALAAQREQTKRMADSLTNTFINSPDSKGESFHNRSSHRKNIVEDDDENVMRLVSSTPSPSRAGVQQRRKNENSGGRGDGKKLFSEPTVLESVQMAPTSTRAKKTTNPAEETRDSPATTATSTTASSPTSDVEEDVIAVKKVPLAPDDETNEDKMTQKLPVVYSTPKKSERLKSSPFGTENDAFEPSMDGQAELFPVSASPKVFNKINSTRGTKSYDEEFPTGTFEQPENDKSKRKMNLLNSIDAFEQSFSIDFTESFTPKEGSRSTPSPSSGSGQKTYNPFFATPEKTKPRFDSSSFSESKRNEDTKTSQSPKMPQMEFSTPPQNTENVQMISENNDQGVRPKRPEKTTPSVARERYERALRPRVESSTQGRQSSVNTSSNNSGALQRRMEQRKRLDKNLQSTSNDSSAVGPSAESSSSAQKKQTRNDIVDIVDAFEQTERENLGAANQQKSPSKYAGPVKSLRRRSVSKPISYAEPPLNTKLRRGDTFFPKTRPDMTDSEDDRNQVPNVIQTPAAVVSP